MTRRRALSGAVAVALLVSAVIHLRLAPGYQAATSGGLGIGTMFRLEAVAAVLAAAYVLVVGNRTSYAVAFAVGAGAFVAVVLYRYVDVPALGPVPAMYEPVWFLEKALSAVAELAAAVLALIGFLTSRAASAPSVGQRRPAGSRSRQAWPWSA